MEVDTHSERNSETHLATVPYSEGEIEFDGHEGQRALYMRVDSNMTPDAMKKLMEKTWDLKNPKLLISVTGGAKDFDLKTRLNEAFRRGLRKAAQIPGAWIVTCGTHAGVMKHVGEAVRDFRISAVGEEGRLTAIGIAPWGCVRNRDKLKKPKGPVRYQIQGEDIHNETFLDPNHSHFILVDNGTEQEFGTEIEFRAALEQKISEILLENDNVPVKVPVALLVLEGGPNTLKTVRHAVENKTPAIVIKGSGRCADLLAEAVQLEAEGKPEMVMYTLLRKRAKELLKSSEREVDEHVKLVYQCLKDLNLLSVYELDAKGKSTSDVDMAILKGLLKAEKGNDKDQVQLELALAWNRVDVAKSELFTDDRRWTTEQLTDVMMQAIKEDKTDFVELFLDNGLSLTDFLTTDRLENLYDWASRRNPIMRSLLEKQTSEAAEKYKLKDVGGLLQELMGKYYESHHSRLSQMSSPAQELFLWSVLMNQQEMAKLFWEKGSESTAAALVANQLLKAMMKHTKDNDVLQTLEKNANEFEELAVGLLSTCYNKDEKKAQKMLVRELPQWGNSSCVLIALKSDNKRFLSQTACKELLKSVWMGGMSHDHRYWKILVSMFLFPLIFTSMIRFQQPGVNTVAKNQVEPESKEKIQPNKDERSMGAGSRLDMFRSLWEKIHMFYHAPVVIFCLTCISYLAFLTFYSYVLLVKLSPTFHFVDVILLVWALSIFAEEIRQIIEFNVNSVRSKWKNVFDGLTIALFLLGFVLTAVVWGSGQPCMDCYEWGRVLLAVDLVPFFLRLLSMFAISEQLGPKVVMIRRMITDLKWFVVILLVFITSYAIASEAILYPNTELSWKMLYHLPRKAYWQIYGELFLEEIEGDDPLEPCTDDPALYADFSQPRCPTDIGQYLVPVLLGLYMLFTNVLLLNLLIAMFSYTFQTVQKDTDIHWHFQRFNLIFEFSSKPAFPPPLIIISFVDRFVCWCRNKSRPTYTYFKKPSGGNEGKQLTDWESITLIETFLYKLEAKEADSVDGRVKALVQRLEAVQSKVDYLHEMQSNVNETATAKSLKQTAREDVGNDVQQASGSHPHSQEQAASSSQTHCAEQEAEQELERQPGPDTAQPSTTAAAATSDLLYEDIRKTIRRMEKHMEKHFEAFEQQLHRENSGVQQQSTAEPSTTDAAPVTSDSQHEDIKKRVKRMERHMERRFEALEQQIKNLGHNMMRSLEARNVASDVTRPELMDIPQPATHRTLGPSTHTEEETA